MQTAVSRNWVPTDGDTFATQEGFIFNVFGYEHPNNRVFCFLKYIPFKFHNLFNIPFLERTWNYRGLKLVRAKKLYTARNYRTFLETFRNNFPNYIYFCPFREKEVISTPINSIKRVYVPRECLTSLRKARRKEKLQKTALNLVKLLSTESGISAEDFGIHGSIALNIHTPESDIDLVVYGAKSFRKLERTIDKLVAEGTLNYVINNRLDAARLYKGRYLNSVFMYNAIRKPEEINSEYGMLEYSPVTHVKFRCTVKTDNEAMFRPAIYKIENYRPINRSSTSLKYRIPEFVVSMVGCYRNVAKRGDEIEVSGVLEHVKNIETDEVFHQAVVGSGMHENEYVWLV